MKKFLSIMMTAILCVLLAVAVSAADVYVNDGGTGDGSAADKPLGNMTDAITKIAETGGKVIIVDNYTATNVFVEPEHKGDIVITGGTYTFSTQDDGSGQVYRRYFLSGPGATTFENITFVYGTGADCIFAARFNKLVFGEGVAFPDTGKAFAIGGYQDAPEGVSYDLDSNITIKSGNFYIVSGWTRYGQYTECTGTAYMNIEGGNIQKIYAGPINGGIAQNTILTITGGEIGEVYTGGDHSDSNTTRRLNGDCIINIEGGDIVTVNLNNVMGHTTINLSGGTVGNASKMMASALAEFVVDGTSTLNYVKGMDAGLLGLWVDEAKEVAAITDDMKIVKPAATGVELKMTLGKTDYTLNGETKTMDVAPIIRNSRTMLPVRYVAEALGAEIAWDGATSTATLKTADTEIKITVGAATATVNGQSVTLDSPAFIENSRTYMPVRFVAETLGGTVAWDGATSTATITK